MAGDRRAETKAPVIRGLHRCHEGQLVFRAAPRFPRPLTAQVGIVDIDPPGQLPIRFLLRHDLDQLVLHQPRRAITRPEMAHQFQR
jgi:hypothetical protein